MTLRSPKYHNTRCQCAQGHIHMSRLEAGHCNKLRLLEKTADIETIEVQKKFPLVVNGVTVCNHYVDFLITYKNGTQEVVESKGMDTGVWILKRKLFEAIYPEIKYTVWRKA